MKKVLLLTLMCAAVVLAGAQNLVVNGGFEQQEGAASPMVDDPVTGFTFDSMSAWTYNDESAKEGKFSASASGVKQARLIQDVVVEQGKTYTMSFYYMDMNVCPQGIRNYSRNGIAYPAPYIDQNDGGRPASVPVSVEEWKKYSITFIALDDVVHLDIRAYVMATIDEVSIVEGGNVEELTADNIEAFLTAKRNGANTTFNNPVTVAFSADYTTKDGKDISATYIQDATGWTALFNNSKSLFKAGDVITGLKGIYGESYGASQMVYASHTDITAGTAPKATAIAVKDLSKTDVNRFVRLEGVMILKEVGEKYTSIYAVKDGEQVLLYDKFKKGITLEEGKRYDIEGAVVLFNGKLEIAMNTATESIEDALVVPTIESVEITETSILNPANKSLSLFSISGQRLFHTTGDIDLSTLNHGVYILKCGTEIQKIRL